VYACAPNKIFIKDMSCIHILVHDRNGAVRAVKINVLTVTPGASGRPDPVLVSQAARLLLAEASDKIGRQLVGFQHIQEEPNVVFPPSTIVACALDFQGRVFRPVFQTRPAARPAARAQPLPSAPSDISLAAMRDVTQTQTQTHVNGYVMRPSRSFLEMAREDDNDDLSGSDYAGGFDVGDHGNGNGNGYADSDADADTDDDPPPPYEVNWRNLMTPPDSPTTMAMNHTDAIEQEHSAIDMKMPQLIRATSVEMRASSSAMTALLHTNLATLRGFCNKVFSHVDVNELLASLTKIADHTGCVTKPQFLAQLQMHTASALNHADLTTVEMYVLDRMEDSFFDFLDIDQSGTVSTEDLAAGLVLLLPGQVESRAALAFGILDANRDGFISPVEMYRGMRSWVSLIVSLDSNFSITSIASKTFVAQNAAWAAKEFFDVVDKNRDGRISLDEFVSCTHVVPWLSILQDLSPQCTTASSTTRHDEKLEEQHKALENQEIFLNVPLVDAARKLTVRKLHLRHVLDWAKPLSKVDIAVVLETFELYAQHGMVGEMELGKCILHLVDLAGAHGDSREQLETLFASLLGWLDVDGDGKLNATEFITPLLCFSDAPLDEKLVVIFSLFDLNGDSFLCREELLNLFRTLWHGFFALSHTGADVPRKALNDGIVQLAHKTVSDVFDAIDTNNDQLISFAELYDWIRFNHDHEVVTMILEYLQPDDE
jgi:Ca2+-binding EF-hand superfamily protein